MSSLPGSIMGQNKEVFGEYLQKASICTEACILEVVLFESWGENLPYDTCH